MIKSSIRRNDLASICATQLALAARTDTTAMLSSITVPTLVIKGKEDKLVNEKQINSLLEGIADVKYVEFAASGHLPNLEEPKNSTRKSTLFTFFLIKERKKMQWIKIDTALNWMFQ